jgi:hypothetical protein
LLGFLNYNNLIHPYFFQTNLILNTLDRGVLRDIFVKIDKPQFAQEKLQIFYPRKSGIENFDFAVLKEVLSNHTIEEVEIERFGTTEGWRFPHNTDYLSTKIKDTFCFIVDDGSCSGDSIIQMIDEISFYQAKEIVLLCFIGRVNDHKREFFSRLSKIKVKDGKSIPISIYFASHWHIPTYYLDDNPNIKETTWLNQIFNLQNTPYNIKKIADNVIREIKPKPIKTFKDYKYLPKLKGTKNIPKKELLLVREELGKVIGYRLYKESFRFFDYFIKKYEKQKATKDRYKEIELLCATFIYEPYLYDKLTIILPDVIEKIEEFVRVLISPSSTIYKLLTYEWNKKDIVHLFFIVFKDEKLIKELTIDNFKHLLDFTKRQDSTTNYVLYKLLRYFPLSSDQFKDKKFDSQIKGLILQLKGDPAIPQKEIRKYYNFITSLPSRNDFKSQVAQLKENYAKHNEPEFHDLKKSFNHNVSLLIVTVREIIADIKLGKSLKQSRFTTVKKCWFTILEFINPILSFSGSFREFLEPYTFFELTSQADRMRQMVGYIEDIILSDNENINDIDKLDLIKEYVVKIQSDFESNSTFSQLVDRIHSNLKESNDKLISDMKLIPNVVLKNEAFPSMEFMSCIPQLYMDKLIISELVTNMKKYIKRESKPVVTIVYKVINQNQLEMKITNKRSQHDSVNSNGEGTKCLKLLSESPIFDFKYNAINDGDFHVQTLTFKSN